MVEPVMSARLSRLSWVIVDTAAPLNVSSVNRASGQQGPHGTCEWSFVTTPRTTDVRASVRQDRSWRTVPTSVRPGLNGTDREVGLP